MLNTVMVRRRPQICQSEADTLSLDHQEAAEGSIWFLPETGTRQRNGLT